MIIDIHHHYLPREFLGNIEGCLPSGLEARREGEVISIVRTEDEYVYPRINVRYWSDPATQLATMDRAGVTHAVLSAACFQDWMTMKAARLINDGTAALVAQYPDRFSGMISVPPDGGDEMVREIRRARDELGLCALNMTTTHGDRYPDHPDFRLFFATAAELDLPVFIHPSWIGPVTTYMDQWNLERTLGKPHDLGLGAARMLFSGEFRRHPNLRMVFGHLGGTLPLMLQRLFFGQKGYLTAPEQDYRSLLKRVFVDTAPGMWQSHEEVSYSTKKLGAEQLLLGSDYPLSMDPEGVMVLAVGHVRDADLSEQDKQKIFCGNAMKLFRLERLADGPVRVQACDCGR
jgi:predicted TIM-barrel fold metal-dependent hydrolase